MDNGEHMRAAQFSSRFCGRFRLNTWEMQVMQLWTGILFLTSKSPPPGKGTQPSAPPTHPPLKVSRLRLEHANRYMDSQGIEGKGGDDSEGTGNDSPARGSTLRRRGAV